MTIFDAQGRETGQLIPESFEDAVEALAYAAGGKKAFAEAIKPELAGEPEKARRWILDALNTEHQQQFHPTHILRMLVIGRRLGCHVLKHWIDRQAGYVPSEPATQPSRRLVLLTEAEWLARRQREVAEELDAIGVAPE